MATNLILNPENEFGRRANVLAFEMKKAIKCPLCSSITRHEHEDGEQWIACQSKECREVFKVSEHGNVWKFCQKCSEWEHNCECMPEDDC